MRAKWIRLPEPEDTMVEVDISIPNTLGLTPKQIEHLAEKFRCDLVDAAKKAGKGTDVEVEVRPKVKNQVV
jgi:hypothetical protein